MFPLRASHLGVTLFLIHSQHLTLGGRGVGRRFFRVRSPLLALTFSRCLMSYPEPPLHVGAAGVKESDNNK